MKSMDAAGRWAKDLYRRFERGAVSGKRVAELFEAITPEARDDLRMTVMVGLEELRDADRGEREFMPPCVFRYLRWLALFLHAPEDDEIGEYLCFDRWCVDLRVPVVRGVREQGGRRDAALRGGVDTPS